MAEFIDKSRPFDVHRWSDHPESNIFVNNIYDEYFRWNNPILTKKHLKVVLLDLYVCWNEDPNQQIGILLGSNAYKAKSRYNALHISKHVIEVVHSLNQFNLIEMKIGWRDETGRSFATRIWAAKKLIKLFKEAKFGIQDIYQHKDRETIILRDSNKKDLEYDDTETTIRMRNDLRSYNKLLHRTFIDIPEYDKPKIKLEEKMKRRKSNKPVYVNISSHEKFVRRIFNNSNWNDGGRFYGGWWLRVDGKHRKGIRFNNTPTVEIDYSSLHVILAYAHVGIDYWESTDKDPYDIPVRGVNNPEHIRDIVKSFFLLSFNASDEKALYKAFRSELDYDKYPYSFPDEVLAELLENIKQTHPKVAHMICSGAGLMLMNMDSRIAEYIIRDFVKTDTPILTVHDSFIVPIGEEDRLDNLMKEAFNEVTKKNKVKVKFNKNMTLKGINQFKFSTGPDREYYLNSMNFIAEGNPTKGYLSRWNNHKSYFEFNI